MGLKAILLYIFSTIWYELQERKWPQELTNRPVEAQIWLLGSSEGIREVLAGANLGKEITVSRGGPRQPARAFASAALTGCFCSPPAGDPVHLLVLGGGRQAHLHPAGGDVGAAPQAEPQAVPPRTLLEERRGTPEDLLPAELRESVNGILEKKCE